MSYALHDSTGLRVIIPPERAFVTSFGMQSDIAFVHGRCKAISLLYITQHTRDMQSDIAFVHRHHFVLDKAISLCYTPSMAKKTATVIRFTDEQLTVLDTLSVKSGKSIAALVRWCLDKSLPILAGNIERSLAVPSESTIDTKLDA